MSGMLPPDEPRGPRWLPEPTREDRWLRFVQEVLFLIGFAGFCWIFGSTAWAACRAFIGGAL